MLVVSPCHLLTERASVGDGGRRGWCSAASPWLRSAVAGEELLVGLEAVVLFGTVVVCVAGVFVCVHELEFVSASGAAMFHLVNITQPAPPLYCHHHYSWQLAGYMLLQLPCFEPNGESK